MKKMSMILCVYRNNYYICTKIYQYVETEEMPLSD